MERLSEPERAEIWDRGEAGESQRSICRVLGRSPSTIRNVSVEPSESWGWCYVDQAYLTNDQYAIQ
jgi:hypothetical protein